jgi:hypothetical protein
VYAIDPAPPNAIFHLFVLAPGILVMTIFPVPTPPTVRVKFRYRYADILKLFAYVFDNPLNGIFSVDACVVLIPLNRQPLNRNRFSVVNSPFVVRSVVLVEA